MGLDNPTVLTAARMVKNIAGEVFALCDRNDNGPGNDMLWCIWPKAKFLGLLWP